MRIKVDQQIAAYHCRYARTRTSRLCANPQQYGANNDPCNLNRVACKDGNDPSRAASFRSWGSLHENTCEQINIGNFGESYRGAMPDS